MYKIIAIEREYASGGSEIGERLAAKLGRRRQGASSIPSPGQRSWRQERAAG